MNVYIVQPKVIDGYDPIGALPEIPRLRDRLIEIKTEMRRASGSSPNVYNASVHQSNKKFDTTLSKAYRLAFLSWVFEKEVKTCAMDKEGGLNHWEAFRYVMFMNPHYKTETSKEIIFSSTISDDLTIIYLAFKDYIENQKE